MDKQKGLGQNVPRMKEQAEEIKNRFLQPVLFIKTSFVPVPIKIRLDFTLRKQRLFFVDFNAIMEVFIRMNDDFVSFF